MYLAVCLVGKSTSQDDIKRTESKLVEGFKRLPFLTKLLDLTLKQVCKTFTAGGQFFALHVYMSRVMRKPTFWFPTWSDTNQAVQLQKMARGLKFRIKKVEGLYYLCSENKGADQLRGYSEADLRLSFRICKTFVFS